MFPSPTGILILNFTVEFSNLGHNQVAIFCFLVQTTFVFPKRVLYYPLLLIISLYLHLSIDVAKYHKEASPHPATSFSSCDYGFNVPGTHKA